MFVTKYLQKTRGNLQCWEIKPMPRCKKTAVPWVSVWDRLQTSILALDILSSSSYGKKCSEYADGDLNTSKNETRFNLSGHNFVCITEGRDIGKLGQLRWIRQYTNVSCTYVLYLNSGGQMLAVMLCTVAVLQRRSSKMFPVIIISFKCPMAVLELRQHYYPAEIRAPLCEVHGVLIEISKYRHSGNLDW